MPTILFQVTLTIFIVMIRFSSLCLLATILFCCQSEKIRKSDIKSAQRLLGLTFTEDQIVTMRGYLERNLEGYDSMRANELSNTIPAIQLNPIPTGFQPKFSGINEISNWEEESQIPSNRQELAYYPISKLAYLIRSRQITSEELTQLFIGRIKKYDPELLAVITLLEDRAMKMARKADNEIMNGRYRGPLHGIPYGIKDLASVDGYPTTWGAMPYKNQMISEDAEIVRRLDESGAVLVAKLVSGALARGDVWFGGQTKNPWDIEKGAGGSSAGSGSATAAGLVAFTIGTETLGSITSPSTRCGVTGLRPTYGRVSRSGVMSLSWSMDKVGPIARNARDCGIILQAIQGTDPKDPMTIEADFSIDFERSTENLRIAYFKDLLDADTTESGDNARKVLQWLGKKGFELTPVKLPSTMPSSAFDVILRAEAGAFFDQLVLTGEDASMVEQGSRSRANSLRQSRFVPAVEYIQANRYRKILIEDFHQVVKDFDVIVTPTFGGKQLMITNLTGHPALAIPTGLTTEGLPTSITFLGNLFDEESILKLADLFQQNTDFDQSIPPRYAP